MTSRPRRSAAAKATESIFVQSKWADSNERSGDSPVPSRRSGRSIIYRDMPSSSESGGMPSRSRQAARRSRRSEPLQSGEIIHGKRYRGTQKSYVLDSSPEEDDDDDEGDDDDDEEEIEDEIEVELDEDDAMEEDAEGEEVEIDAGGEEMDADGEEMDADGDVDMDAAPRRNKVTSIKLSRSGKPRDAARAAASRIIAQDDDDDDDELSEPDSDPGDETMDVGDETMADEDAEGEDAEAEDADNGEDEEDDDDNEEQDDDEDADPGAGEQDDNLDSEEDGSRANTPDFAKMTKRQRARFNEQPHEYMKLSDEVQAKKVFTAEELSMRRQEMARRRRNLSEKRNEEVKMETINKLLKKQAPKTLKKGARGTSPEADAKAAATLIRWVSNKSGSMVAVPSEVMGGPVGDIFGPPGKEYEGGNDGLGGSKMVEEVA